MTEPTNQKNQPVQISVNLDTTPVLYTDNVNMTVNPNGVVLDIMQRLGPTNQVRIVSRIGMSREHAKKFLDKLGKLLLKSEGVVVTGEKIIN
ncbi:MAG: hypothetical protein US95_C0048G0003 [Candidatus Woesebacteria bacterium GW2011_GWB1_38_5]|uniref:Uncharacterized protein n=4 Tax=Candidatus Woeseibacteriota TaxID=1752722 RepID=A0A0G0P300_9BACT|nr:MAG: hypothetical protein US67_C0063G0003 [Candidatus Woesebacteria bacterium GW2011_GWD1_38_10]KKQ56073.1 MAG: hypothetical protein US75_C0010G0019 [Candidatus Woesebacteria bacterium GW2011_GWC1_38_13]KKQ73718.1 MAG: hypothetical protein US95_C0048G0003 [Candidatus Woesebacteria bacterium GW2011_GWB1_38_5]KKQ76672.1 MAG: hypothetical protein US97_C0001G0020 [Microgenomates group bacterium GW2011_GWF1_38_5]KKQ83631.1 MAG: hypothetical protein UT06_C0019G0011 [Candidatus Woesebacteria bacter